LKVPPGTVVVAQQFSFAETPQLFASPTHPGKELFIPPELPPDPPDTAPPLAPVAGAPPDGIPPTPGVPGAPPDIIPIPPDPPISPLSASRVGSVPRQKLSTQN